MKKKNYFIFNIFNSFTVYIKLKNLVFCLYSKKRLFYFQFNLHKLLKIIPIFTLCVFVLFFIINNPNPARISHSEKNFIEENDSEDIKAKKADKAFLEETEKQRRAVITAKEIEIEKKSKPKFTVYTVKKGDKLSSIANKHKVTIHSIIQASNLKSKQIIKGQKLTIPNNRGFTYRIVMGDTLAGIAHIYKVDIDSIIQQNKLDEENIDILPIGKSIFLPGAKAPSTLKGWLVPTATNIVTSKYGWRTFPRARFHEGLDLKSHYAPVRASKSGKVIFAGWLGGYGYTVVIDHGNKMKTLYAHNSRLYVKRGVWVQRGQIISQSGNTGYSFGPHLHFEIIKNGKTVDPRKYLRNLRTK